MIELEKIIEIIKSTGVVKDITKYDPEKTFQDNGIDSLDTFTIFLAVEEQLGIKFSEKNLNR
ncbi:MAG: phosphopantetheine-binding protein [Candidatus Electrothrix sp. Rat3]|nr:phosphopantetheine-binding protein [Candidatus Electrothrix rattekaaiensis]